MAGVIGVDGINVMYQAVNPKDFNLCIDTGVYSCGGSSALNAPTSAPYGTLLVFKAIGLDEGYSVQLFASRGSTPHFYYRTGKGTWQTIS